MKHTGTESAPLFTGLPHAGLLKALAVPMAESSGAFSPRAVPIAAAAAHAERDVPGWKREALAFLLRFAETHAEFTGEDVVGASKGVVPDAPDDRAWGAVVQGAARDGLVVKCGYAARKLNGSPGCKWRKAT